MRFLFTLLLTLAAIAARADGVAITAESWRAARSAAHVTRLPGLAALITAFDKQPQGILVVHHAATTSAHERAEALRDWLAALGIPSARVHLERDPLAAEVMTLEVRAHGDQR